jgi:hypothetical protein
MSSGVIYPPPTYIPPLPVFNSLFFPQSFDTTTTSGGGGGGFTNIFPNGLTSGNVITMDGGTGGGGGTGVERTITGLSQIEWVDITDTNPTAITGYMVLNGNTLEIGSNTALSGINVNLLGSVVSANGTPIATGGNVSNNINNTFQAPATTQTFDSQNVIVNGGSVVLNTTASQYPITITNESTSATDNILQFQPNPSLSAGQYIFQTYGSGYVDTAIIDYTGIELVNAPFKSSLNATPSTLQLPTNYSCFYSNNQQPYFAYNNVGSVNTTSLIQTNLIGSFQSSVGIITSGIIKWTFQNISSFGFGQQFSFGIFCDSPKTNSNSPYLANSVLQLNSQFTNAMSVSGYAILLPFQYSNGGVPTPITSNESGFVFNIVSNIGGLTIQSNIIGGPSFTGMEYEMTANVANNPYTAGSTITLKAFSPIL